VTYRTESQFYALLTTRRDEGLAHCTAIVERSGLDEWSEFVVNSIMPLIADADDRTVNLIGHLALIGAFDAALAYRDKQNTGE
jgi:hypothetical protein